MLAALIALALALTACDSGTTDPGAETTESENGGTTGEQVDLLVWSSRPFYVPEDEFAGLMDEYPNLNVTYDVYPNDDIIQQLQRARDAGQRLPDVILDDSPMTAAYYDLDFLLPIDDLVAQWEEEDPELYNKISPNVWQDGMHNGELVGMPTIGQFDLLYYNIPWFEEAGVTTPVESWDDLLEAARALEAARPDDTPMSVQFVSGEGINDRLAFMAAIGVPFEEGLPDLTSEQGTYVIDWYMTLAEEGMLAEDAIAWGEAEARGAFIGQRTGMIIEGLQTAVDFIETPDFALDEQWGVMPLPKTRSGGEPEGETIIASRDWHILSSTEHPYEASLVLRYVAETPQVIGQVTQGGAPGRQSEAIASPEIAEFWPFFDEELQEVYMNAVAAPAPDEAAEMQRILETMFQEIVTGTGETAAEMAARYQTELDALS